MLLEEFQKVQVNMRYTIIWTVFQNILCEMSWIRSQIK